MPEWRAKAHSQGAENKVRAFLSAHGGRTHAGSRLGYVTAHTSYSAHSAAPGKGDIGTRTVIPFVLLTFGITWGLMALMIFGGDLMTSLFGELGVTHPVYILAVWSPAVVAFILILLHAGPGGMRRFLGRLSPRGVTPAWWALAFLALPLVKILSAMLNGTPFNQLLVLQPFGEVLLVTAFMLVLGPVEEFGWRGLMLPLMQRVIAPVWAGLLVGFAWAIWHIPAFYLGGTPHTAWALAPFVIGVTAVGVVMAVVYNRTRGNLLLPIVIHWQLNVAFWPEAQPWENYLNVALAVVLVWAHRDVMLSRPRAETVVVPA